MGLKIASFNAVLSASTIYQILYNYQTGSKRFARRNLLTAMEGEDMEQIKKCLLQCERTQIGEDDADMEYARQKIEVLTLRKGTLNQELVRKTLS